MKLLMETFILIVILINIAGGAGVEWCFAKEGNQYVIYLREGGTTTLLINDYIKSLNVEFTFLNM